MKKSPKNSKKFHCEFCNFYCSKLSEWNIHILRPKHISRSNGNEWNNLEIINLHTNKNICNCGKKYVTSSGLWKHKQKCIFVDEKQECNETNISNDIILEIVKQNQEFQKLILEQNKQIIELSKNNSITNNTNCHNKTKFNLQFFLNETCKDAVNLMDFVNDLQIKLSDLENVGKLGYVDGISKIFINGLKELDVVKRPIHCSDVKREVLYIKDQNTWEKENEENKRIKKAIHHISSKNIQQIQKWTETHPHCKESDSRENDQYMKILCESMGSAEPSNLEKVIRNVAREVIIDK
jgi:hypothetical protein